MELLACGLPSIDQTSPSAAFDDVYQSNFATIYHLENQVYKMRTTKAVACDSELREGGNLSSARSVCLPMPMLTDAKKIRCYVRRSCVLLRTVKNVYRAFGRAVFN